MALRKLNLAPIGPNPENVLDLGTGLAITIFEFYGSNLATRYRDLGY